MYNHQQIYHQLYNNRDVYEEKSHDFHRNVLHVDYYVTHEDKQLVQERHVVIV
uniref:Uncharacterized protein n=1 Tax=Schistosoma curassoni TaxID=6186 RepID=A0A183KFV7_9TREM